MKGGGSFFGKVSFFRTLRPFLRERWFSNHLIFKIGGHIGILYSFKNFGGVSGGPSAISEVGPKGGGVVFSNFEVFQYTIPISLWLSWRKKNINRMQKIFSIISKTKFINFIWCIHFRHNLNYPYFNKNFSFLEKPIKKLKSIQKFRENDLESTKIPYGYEKASIFYELFAQKKIKLIA